MVVMGSCEVSVGYRLLQGGVKLALIEQSDIVCGTCQGRKRSLKTPVGLMFVPWQCRKWKESSRLELENLSGLSKFALSEMWTEWNDNSDLVGEPLKFSGAVVNNRRITSCTSQKKLTSASTVPLVACRDVVEVGDRSEQHTEQYSRSTVNRPIT